MLRKVLCLCVSKNGSSRTAYTRKYTHEGTDQGRTEYVNALALEIFEGECGFSVHLAIHFVNLKTHTLLCLFEDLGDREQTDQNREQLEAVLHFGLEHCRNHTVSIVYAEHTDQAGQYAEEACEYTAEHLALGQSCDNGQCEQDDEEFLNCAELQCCCT